MSSSDRVRRWHPIDISDIEGRCCVEDMLRVMSHGGTPARCPGVLVGSLQFEVFCGSLEEAAQAEIRLRQLLADQQLRREIERKADARISDIIDAVICRASGT